MSNLKVRRLMVSFLKMSKLQPEYQLHHRMLRQFCLAVRKFDLIDDGDRILIGLSGGKDSLALLDFLGEVRMRSNHCFEIKAVHVRMKGIDYLSDVSYMERQASKWEIPLEVTTAIMEPDRKVERTPCFLCSWNRRKRLFQLAQEQGFNKIALGHHQDDIIRTALMNLSYNGNFSTMPVKLVMRKFPVTIIRPLAMMKESDLKTWATFQNYEPVVKVCPNDGNTSRNSIRCVFESFESLSPDFRQSIWHALEKVGALENVPDSLK